MTIARTTRSRTDYCCICDTAVESTSTTTSDHEAPEMIQLPTGAWCGIVQDPERRDGPLLVVCCSDACATTLLREEP
jgi:hypothetical protein